MCRGGSRTTGGGTRCHRPSTCVSVAPTRRSPRVVGCAQRIDLGSRSIDSGARRWTAPALLTADAATRGCGSRHDGDGRADPAPESGHVERVDHASHSGYRSIAGRSAADPGVDHDVVETPGGGGAHRRDRQRDPLLALESRLLGIGIWFETFQPELPELILISWIARPAELHASIFTRSWAPLTPGSL